METFYQDSICYIVNWKTKGSILYSRLLGLERFQIVLYHDYDKDVLERIAVEMKDMMKNIFIDMICIKYCQEHNLTTITPEMVKELSIKYSDIPQYAHLFKELTTKTEAA